MIRIQKEVGDDIPPVELFRVKSQSWEPVDGVNSPNVLLISRTTPPPQERK